MVSDGNKIKHILLVNHSAKKIWSSIITTSRPQRDTFTFFVKNRRICNMISLFCKYLCKLDTFLLQVPGIVLTNFYWFINGQKFSKQWNSAFKEKSFTLSCSLFFYCSVIYCGTSRKTGSIKIEKWQMFHNLTRFFIKYFDIRLFSN